MGVAVLFRDAPHFKVEDKQPHGKNATIFKLASGGRRWFISGCYITPDDITTIESIVVAISQCTRGALLLAAGYFNDDLAELEGSQGGEDIVVAILMVLATGYSVEALTLR